MLWNLDSISDVRGGDPNRYLYKEFQGIVAFLPWAVGHNLLYERMGDYLDRRTTISAESL